MSNYIVMDLEATCWAKGTRPERMETIEIGAVMVDDSSWSIVDEFSRFVRPTDEPTLSSFCTELTGISQEDVDGAPTFSEVLEEFTVWIGAGENVICSWGAYDVKQIEIDCKRHGLETPTRFQNHLNLKATFAEQRSIRPCGMKKALNILGLSLKGRHHRGIDDARNIAQILSAMNSGWQT